MARAPQPHITADFADCPYMYIGRLNAIDIVLAYGIGHPWERWRRTDAPNVNNSSFVIRVDGRTYRFAGHIRKKNPAALK